VRGIRVKLRILVALSFGAHKTTRMESLMKFNNFLSGPRLIFLLILTGLYLAGYATAEYDLLPKTSLNKFVSWAKPRIRLFTPQTQPKRDQNIETIFLSLNIDSIQVPTIRKGSGGGLTSAGSELILLTHEGHIFSINNGELHKTNIRSPDNGFNEYLEISKKDEYKNLDHSYEKFRYNDLLYYEEGGKSFLVASYTEWRDDERCYNTAIARLSLPFQYDSIRELKAARSDWQISYRTQPCLPLKYVWRAIEGHMAGGRISYLSHHKIVLGSGDYSWDGIYAPDSFAQLSGNDYGKVIEIDLEKKHSRILTRGNRNMQGVIVDDHGNIWVVEHGARGGDELNLIIEGGNYGWPKESYGTRYNKLPLPEVKHYGHHDVYVRPVFSWVPSVATSGLTQIKDFDPTWDGDLLVASLKNTLYRLRIREGRVIFSEPIKIGERVRYVHQHIGGLIVVWTDSHKLMFLTRAPQSFTQQRIDRTIDNLDYNANQKRMINSAIDRCSECHAFDANDNVNAPALGKIFGSDIASANFANYSTGLRSNAERWSEAALASFLDDPQNFAQGSTMPDPGIEEEYIIDGIISVLKDLAESE